MPAHNWKGIYDGIFHQLHHNWVTHLSDCLNQGLLPPSYFALAEQRAGQVAPDVLTLEIDEADSSDSGGGTAILAPPKTAIKKTFDVLAYVNRQNRIVIRHVSPERVVAVFEIVSRGNKAGRQNLETFLEKANGCLERRIHFSFVDVHAPGNFDPDAIHGEICRDRGEEPPLIPFGKNLAAAGYEADGIVSAYVNPFGIGDVIPDTPLFLRSNSYVMLPLEETYMKAFSSLPRHYREQIEKNTNAKQ